MLLNGPASQKISFQHPGAWIPQNVFQRDSVRIFSAILSTVRVRLEGTRQLIRKELPLNAVAAEYSV